jgi:sarcosine oxidase subunit gamma
MPDAALRRRIELPPAAWLDVLQPASRCIFRGSAAARAGAGRAFGVALPETACRAATDGTRAALWLGPDEHLLLAPDGETAAIEASIAQALPDHAYSLVDVSHRQVGIGIHGPHAQWLLEGQCPLPLNLRDFPPGMCTRTVFGKAEIVLWRPAEQVFRLEAWRSFAAYVVGLLREIDREWVARP